MKEAIKGNLKSFRLFMTWMRNIESSGKFKSLIKTESKDIYALHFEPIHVQIDDGRKQCFYH